MAQQNNPLFSAFREDHALLGRGFFEIAQCLRSNDVAGAHRVAERLDRQAGAHMAFEEEDFYPRLLPLLGQAEVDRLYADHGQGLSVVEALAVHAPTGALSETMRRQLLAHAEAMAQHIAECGELFEVMGRIPPDEQDALYRRLIAWREQAPSWTEQARRAAHHRRSRT